MERGITAEAGYRGITGRNRKLSYDRFRLRTVVDHALFLKNESQHGG